MIKGIVKAYEEGTAGYSHFTGIAHVNKCPKSQGSFLQCYASLTALFTKLFPNRCMPLSVSADYPVKTCHKSLFPPVKA